MKKLLPFLAILCLPACSSLTVYSHGQGGINADGTRHPDKAIPKVKFYGDTYGPTTVKPDGSIEVTDFNPGNVLYAYTAVTDGKGNPLFDKAGNPIYNTTPVVPGIRNSEATMSFWRGLSLFTRSVSNLAGTIGASLFGVEAAQQVGGAASSGVSYLANP